MFGRKLKIYGLRKEDWVIKQRLTLIAICASLACLFVPSVFADQFDIGNTASCPNSVNSTACPYLYPAGSSANEVIGINGSTLTMFNNGGHTISTDYSQFLLIVGVPNQNGSALMPTITSITPNGATVQSGGSITWTAATYQGQMLSGSVCGTLGFPNPDQGDCNSDNYGNWTGADAVPVTQGGAGIAVNPTTGYAVFTYSISGLQIPATNPDAYISLTFSGSGLAVGDMVIAYGCQTAPLPCKNDSSTPFTQSGMVTNQQVPEPTSMTFLAGGVLILSRRAWRRAFRSS